MVDGTGLENRHTLTGIGGSNPSLSAISHISANGLVSAMGNRASPLVFHAEGKYSHSKCNAFHLDIVGNRRTISEKKLGKLRPNDNEELVELERVCRGGEWLE